MASGFLHEVGGLFLRLPRSNAPSAEFQPMTPGPAAACSKKPNRARRLDARKKMKLIDVLDRLHFADWRRFRIRSVYNRFDNIELTTNPSGAGHGMPIAQIPMKYPLV